MAIDTRDKRASVSSIPSFPTLPLADGTISGSDKAHIGWIYRGITLSSGNQLPQKYAIELRNSSGTLKKRWENMASNPTWEWNARGGCGTCDFTITGTYTDYTIEPEDDIRIWIKDIENSNTGKLVYRGYIASWERFLGSEERIAISCEGYFNKLRRYIVNDSGSPKVYESQSIESIVDDLIETFVTPNTTPEISLGTVDVSNFSPDYLEFKTSVADALEVLASLLNNVEYGVDEDLNFFWRTETLAINTRFYIGKDISEYSELTETEEIVNKIYFEGNTQNDVVFTGNGSSSSSQTKYGLREEIASNSSVNSSSTANQIMNATFLERNRPKVKINLRVHNQTKRFEDTIPMGTVQISNPATNQIRNVWGTTANGGSNLIWGKTASSGSNALWGGVPYHLINRIRYIPTGVDGYFDYELELGGSRFDTPALINQIDSNLEAVRLRQI